MAEIKFVKYNRTRREEFQIKTEILESEGMLWVDKSALCGEGVPHIRSFDEKYKKLSAQSVKLSYAEPKLKNGGRTAEFRYLRGKTLAEQLVKILAEEGPDAFYEELYRALKLLLDVKPEMVDRFKVTPEFIQVFGSAEDLDDSKETPASIEEALDGPAFRVSNIDALFENMMVTEDGVFALDYEWVFDFPIPVSFIRFRTLYYFYQNYKSLIGGTLEAFLASFGVDEPQLPVFLQMERSFQGYVHGENQRIYLEDFIVETKNARELTQMDQELIRTRERIAQLQAALSERGTVLKKTQEIQRLTNNHVANLEAMIGNLRRDTGEMEKTLSYLKRHEALLFKIFRKLKQAFNKRYPKGTRRRRILSYTKNTVLHPCRSFRLYTTPEGRNRIKGEFEIGEEYFVQGRLTFPVTEKPAVSIIIPVYNQIHYTYLCLLSILNLTDDVSYEVIIADDVSTDATAHLGEFAENITICRNETNQGFLKNCNQAAKAARGQYLMFLNNDTQVTKGWLSSLVTLLEADPSIGMAGSKLVYPDGRLQEAGGIIWSDGSGWNYGRLEDPDKAEYNYVKDVDYISGAAILLPRALWEQLGGFDERYAPAYCEDSDLAFEVRKAGLRVVYQPLSKVVHYEGISNGTDVNGEGSKRYQVENSEKLKKKWKQEFAAQCDNTGNPNPFRARERSMGKPVILVVDHYVPTYDKDAGSKTTLQYLKMFLKKGYVVKFLGDNYLREEPYTTALLQMGIEVLYGQEYQTGIWDWLDRNGGEIDFAYLNRPHIASKYVDYIKEHTNAKVIYYGHDLHFLREFREYELTGDPKKKRESEYWKGIEFTLMHKADAAYYPSWVEVEAIRTVDPEIQVKAITAYVYEEFLKQLNLDFGKREGLLFVGGFAHPPNADAVLWFAREIFPIIRQSLDVNFYVVGSRVTEEITALEKPGNGIVVKGFVSEEELSRLYESCRVVVVPLRYGAGIKGKVVEALYNGAPIITTSVGSEGIPEVDDVLVVRDKPEAFAQAVLELYSDTARLKELAAKTQEYIRAYFGVDAAWNVISEDFKPSPR